MRTPKELNYIITEIEHSRDILVPVWATIAKWLIPESGQFFGVSKKNKEYQIDINRYREMIDIQPRWALKTATSGILNALMPENRKWFAFENSDKGYDNYGLAKDMEKDTYDALHRDGFYSLAAQGIQELNVFGTFMKRKQFTPDGIKFIKFPIGSYSIGQNIYEEDDKVSVKYEYQKYEFEKEFKVTLKKYKDKKPTDTIYFHTLAIKNYDNTPDDKGRKREWIEYYFDGNEIFKTEGYRENPYDISKFDSSQTKNGWGVGNGIRSIGSIKSQQMLMLEFCNALEKQMNPATAYDASIFNNGRIDLNAGGVNAVVRSGGDISKTVLTSMQNINFNYEVANYMMDKFTSMINKCLDADIFVSVSGARKQMTAYETGILEQEKILRLGALSSNLTKNFIRPTLMGYADYYYYKHGLKKQDQIDITFYGYMALVQKMQEVNNLIQGMGIIGKMSGIMPSILARIKEENIPEKVVKLLNLDADLLATPEEAEAKINAQMRAQAAAQGINIPEPGSAVSEAQNLAEGIS